MHRGTQYPDRASWLAARGIGSSDVSAILGVSPYRSPWDVWARHHGEAVAEPPTAVQLRGQRWEPVVIAAYWGETGVMPTPTHHALWRHPAHEWATASPDALVREGEYSGAVEAKTDASSAGKAWGESTEIRSWSEGALRHVRGDYALQCYWQAAVCGLDYVDLAVLLPFYELRRYRIWRDLDLEQSLLAEVSAWRERHLVAGEPPPIDGSEGCTSWLGRRFQGGEPPRLATPEEAAMVREYAETTAALKYLEARKSELRAHLLAAAGDAGGLLLEDRPKAPRLSVVRSKGRRYFAEDRLRQDQPELAPVLDSYYRDGSPSVSLRTYNLEDSR